MIFLISKYLFFIFFLTISIYFAKKKNIFLNLHHLSSHKNFVENSKNTPVLLGLFFLLGLILFNYINNINLLFLCVVIFILGFFLDLGINISPRWRILSQFFLVLILIIFFNIKIVDLRNDLLNSFLKIKYLSIFFTAFCFLILINGSNFIDGLNTLLLGYYVIIYSIIYFLQIYVGPINVLGILLILSIIFLFNFFGRSFTGDGGSYLISFISGYLLLTIHMRTNSYISPYYFCLLLWYPAFENLFSIIRKRIKNKNPAIADNQHLHHLIYIYFKQNFNAKLNRNTLSALLINFYNLIILLIGSFYLTKTKILILLIFFNILVYSSFYYYLSLKIKKISR